MRTSALALVLGSAALVAACAPDDDAVADRTFDPCAPLVVRAASASPAQAAGITEALGLWQAQGALGLATSGPLAGAPVIELVFEPAAPQLHGAYDDEAGVVYINVDLAGAPLAIVIAHELGHALGLLHVDATVRESLMNAGNLATPPTLEDGLAVAAIWGRCGAD